MSVPTLKPVQARGAARRQALLDAAIRLLARDGARGVTHRAVAEEAGTTHGAPRYYFSTRDQLLDQALRQIAAEQVAAAEALLAEPAPSGRSARAARLASFIGGQLAADRDSSIARYELFLEAARRPSLRGAIEDWRASYVRLFAGELTAPAPDPDVEAEILLNLLNGLLLQQLATPKEDFDDAVLRPAIERFLGDA